QSQPEAKVVDKRREVAAIDALAVPTGTGRLPRPIARRVPVGDVVMLIFITEKPHGDGDHALALHLCRPTLDAPRRRINSGMRSPHTETFPRLARVPQMERDARLNSRCAPLGPVEIFDQLAD